MRFFQMSVSIRAYSSPLDRAWRRLEGRPSEIGKAALILIMMLSAWAAFIPPAHAETRMWVAVDDAKRRSCPSVDCGIIGRLFFRETVVVYETRNGWSRVSGRSTAGCNNGKSVYIEEGRNDCTEENGISDGKFTIWVKSDALAAQKPAYQP